MAAEGPPPTHPHPRLLPPPSSGNDVKVMQARSQLCYKVAIWARSAKPAANVRSWGQLAEILPAVGVGEGGRGGAGVQASANSEGNQVGCLVEWLAG